MRVRSGSGLNQLSNPPVSTSTPRPSFRTGTLSRKAKSTTTKARFASAPFVHPKLNVRICLHRGESPTLQLLSSRVSRFAKHARSEVKSKRKSPAKVLCANFGLCDVFFAHTQYGRPRELVRTNRLLKNRVAMISRCVATGSPTGSPLPKLTHIAICYGCIFIRKVAHAMEETKESFARIRLESICRSKLNAENSLRR